MARIEYNTQNYVFRISILVLPKIKMHEETLTHFTKSAHGVPD